MSHLVFVYGTLKRGGAWNHLLESARFVGAGRTRHSYPLYINKLPYLFDEEFGAQVAGELYEVDNETLSVLDELEHHPMWYTRKIKPVVLPDGEYNAYIYFLNPASYQHLDWRSLPFSQEYNVNG